MDETTVNVPAEAPETPSSGLALRETAGTDSQEQKSESSKGWLDRILGRSPSTSRSESASTPSSDSPTVSQSIPAKEAPKEATAPATAKREYTPDEFTRAVQSEKDKQLSRDNAKHTREQEKALLRDDPFTASEKRLAQMQEEDTFDTRAQQTGEVVGNVARAYDSAILDPIFTALPKETQAQVIKDMGDGLEGRAKGVQLALAEIKKASFAEGAAAADKRLRGNPAFQKQLLAEMRRNAPDPELSPIGQSPGDSVDMNALIRHAAGKG